MSRKDEKTFSARHTRWAMSFAERLAPDLLTERQAVSLASLIADADNLRGAILWAKEQQDAETALRLTNALWRLMEIKGFYDEGCARLRLGWQGGHAGSPGVRFPRRSELPRGRPLILVAEDQAPVLAYISSVLRSFNLDCILAGRWRTWPSFIPYAQHGD